MQSDKLASAKFLILGAGLAGLGAGIQAQRLGQESLILEESSKPGGLCKNIIVSECDFDFGPKILLLDDSEDSSDLLSFLNMNYEEYPVIERVYLAKYGLLGFPLQRHLIDLPVNERTKILEDIERARQHPGKIKSYRDWLVNSYGQYLCEKVLIPYEEKKWQTSLENLDHSWALSRPVKVDISEIIRGSMHALAPNRKYYYPKRGNISVLSDAMADRAGPISYNSKVISIDPRSKTVVTATGEHFNYQYLVSTLPLNYEVAITEDMPKELSAASKKILQGLSIKVFNMVFKGDFDLDGTAIYFPEKQFIFRRVSILQNLCPALFRKGFTPISVEISIDPSVEQIDDKGEFDRIMVDFRSIPQFAQLGEPLDYEMLYINFAYPLQKMGLKDLVEKIQMYYARFEIYHCGRGGNFDYCNSNIAYQQGKQTIKDILGRRHK